MTNLKQAIILFLVSFAAILLFAELGNRYGSYTNKEGSFFMLVFWGSIISGVFTILYIANKKDTYDK